MNLRSFRIMRGVSFIILFTLFSLTLSASLLDVYKSGKIKLVPDPDFGKGTEWDIYFPQGIKDIAFLPDGSFFATGLGNKACHCVYKFNKKGKFIKKFGRKGRGPGDLYHPGALSILDNKYLLVADYPLNMKISVFDLNGNFVKIIRTKEPVFNVMGFDNNKIIIVTMYSGNKDGMSRIKLNLFDFGKGVIKKINEYKRKESYSPVVPGAFFGELYISKINNKRFVAGITNQREFDIYTNEGKLIRKVDTGFKKREITKEEKKAFEKTLDEIIKKGDFRAKMIRRLLSKMKYPEYGTYYEKIFTDEEENIFVIKALGPVYSCSKYKVKIYDSNGIKINEIVIDKNKYPEYVANNSFFYKDYVYFSKLNDDVFRLTREKIEK